MNFSVVHLHLAINHSPLYTELFALILMVIGMVRRNRTLITSGLVVTVIAGLCAIAAAITGNGAADFIDHSPPIAGVDKMAIGEHDAAATYLLWAACITGGLAIIALWIGRKRERPRWVEMLVTIAILFSLTVVARVALLGGRIHHPEVRAVTGGPS